MAVDMFLKVTPSLGGESVDKTHAGEIDVLAWSWGMSQSGTTHAGPGAGAGKVNVQDLSVTKYVDSASPKIQLFCANGKHLDEAVLFVRKAGENPLEYIKVTMTDLIITSVSTGGSGGEDRLTENVVLNFATVKFEYTPQKEDGSGGTVIPYTWKIAENVAG
jgi:type VI secretion system secreted protein Hcp